MAGGEEFVEPCGGGLGLGPQGGCELDTSPPSARDVIDRAGGDRDAEHLFEADGLRAELNLVVVPTLATTSLVLDRLRDLASLRPSVAEFDEIGHPRESQTVADQSESAGGAAGRARPIGNGVGATVVERPAGRVDVFDPYPLDPQQRTAPFAEQEVIQGRERRVIVALGGLSRVHHDVASTKR
jgi:hypothetical protein